MRYNKQLTNCECTVVTCESDKVANSDKAVNDSKQIM